jgi:uncharacterized protein
VPDAGKALITGASAGIGRAFAVGLAQRGYDLIVTARRRSRLEELASSLTASAGVSVEVHPADLSEADELAGLVDRASSDPALTLLVNNAGFGAYRPFVEIDPEVARSLVDVHVNATVQLTRAVLPGMVERGGGAVINIASLLAFSGLLPSPPLPHRATYAGAKSFMVTFTQTLAGELTGTGVHVMVSCPGVVDSEFHDVQGMDMSQAPAKMSAEDLVKGTLRGLELGEVICIPGLEYDALLQQMLQAQLMVMGSAGGPDTAGRLASRYSSS